MEVKLGFRQRERKRESLLRLIMPYQEGTPKDVTKRTRTIVTAMYSFPASLIDAPSISHVPFARAIKVSWLRERERR